MLSENTSYELTEFIRKNVDSWFLKKDQSMGTKDRKEIPEITPIHDTVHVTTHEPVHDTENMLVLLQRAEQPCSRQVLQEAIEIKNRAHFAKTYLKPLLEEGYLQMTLPEKPKSKFQEYCTSVKGKEWISEYHKTHKEPNDNEE